MFEAFRLLIGSLGGDSHSIGMYLLKIAFREAGFFVKNIGIMNVLEDFFARAENFDAIFISCMNGRIDLYLKDFPIKLKKFNLKNNFPKVWYLGGNLSVQDGYESVIKKYRKMGFDFVSPGPITCDAIMIEKMIEEADIFQLFWSPNAKESEEVRKEWKIALKCKKPCFIRPIYWIKPLENYPPPKELKHIHFTSIRGRK